MLFISVSNPYFLGLGGGNLNSGFKMGYGNLGNLFLIKSTGLSKRSISMAAGSFFEEEDEDEEEDLLEADL